MLVFSSSVHLFSIQVNIFIIQQLRTWLQIPKMEEWLLVVIYLDGEHHYKILNWNERPNTHRVSTDRAAEDAYFD